MTSTTISAPAPLTAAEQAAFDDLLVAWNERETLRTHAAPLSARASAAWRLHDARMHIAQSQLRRSRA